MFLLTKFTFSLYHTCLYLKFILFLTSIMSLAMQEQNNGQIKDAICCVNKSIEDYIQLQTCKFVMDQMKHEPII